MKITIFSISVLASATLMILPRVAAQTGAVSQDHATSKLPVELIFSADHFTVRSNGELRLPIRWINHSDEQLPCPQSTSTEIDERYLYNVRTSDGAAVPRIPGKERERAVIYPTTGALFCKLAPGEAQDQVVAGLMGAFEMNRPGNYTVQVSLPDPDHPGLLLGRSNVVTVTVKAPQ